MVNFQNAPQKKKKKKPKKKKKKKNPKRCEIKIEFHRSKLMEEMKKIQG